MRYDAAPAVAAAFGIAGAGEMWRLTAGGLAPVPADVLVTIAVAVVGVAVVRSSPALLATPRGSRSPEPHWSLAPLVVLVGAHRLAELVPRVGSAALVAAGTVAVTVSASLTVAMVRVGEPARAEHLFPTATTGYVLSLAFAGASTVLASAAFAGGTLGWLFVAGALARRGRTWPDPSVVSLTPPALGGLAWLSLRGAHVDAIAVAFAAALAVTVVRLPWTAETSTWTALFPLTAAARFVVTLSGGASTRSVAWVAAAAVAAPLISICRPPQPITRRGDPPMTPRRTIHADALVVGSGRSGKTAALALGKAGKTVVIVEQSDQMYGGTCPNVGCVPTKMLVHYSGQRRPGDSSQDWYEHSVNGVRDLTTLFRNGNFEALNGGGTTTVITGRASFEDAHTVVVGEGDDQMRITAETIVVGTGAQPVIPPIPGLRESSYLHTNVELIRRTDLPRRLAIIGGGYLGLEFASIYHQFGSTVTVLEGAPRLLGREDEDIAEAALGILAAEGVELVTGARVVEVRDNASTVTVVYERDGARHEVEADGVLAAVGRAPATMGLGLENAGVALDERGAVVVDDYLRTSQHHIFAVGDVNGGPQFTYIAQDDGFIVADQLVGKGERAVSDRVAVPQVLFMTPPLATVGLTEKQARAEGRNITIAREAVADIVAMPRAYVVEETRGLMKFVVDADTDQILGAALLSIDAQELINTVALAMRHRITATELRTSIYTHPSSTEAFNEVLGAIVSEPAATAR